MNTVLITGTSSGFGYLTTLELLQSGATVYASMRELEKKNKEKAKKLEQVAQSLNGVLYLIDMDVTDEKSIRNVKSKIEENGHTIDVLINNAGLGCKGIMESFTTQQHKNIFEVNYFGVINVTNVFLPHLRSNKGRIINISSLSGRISGAFNGPYAASKFALEAYTTSLRAELIPLGLQVGVVEPGIFNTEMQQKFQTGSNEAVLESYGPVVEFMKAQDAAFAQMMMAGIPGPEMVSQTIGQLVSAEVLPQRTVVDYLVKDFVEKLNKAEDDVNLEIQQFLQSLATQQEA
ncbi:SDR family oxidoreductase [Sediminitomix flava]|uniref:NAD(P)-dependent dehydrogenase (Short-subunit alcohol dehydrogenase family) n=1 Tax=Sediminitomix flava TaxID=379075 RepID=A0A315ZZG4_SEDFL|nr:SDR family oxidoreductase [Sediminitomix flava]PWJ42757.1 NAD(P)-dependent dehydrogenase (short-subunit alcohol dehydrogenase family) [Sediminitomix flava]